MTTERGASASVLAAAALWGTTGTAAAFAPDVSPPTVGAVAMGVGGLLQAAVNAPALRRHGREIRANLGVVVLGALCVFAYPLAFYTSMRIGGVALGTTVSLASAPLASAVIERFTDRRRLGARWLTACALGIAGSALLSLSHGGDGDGSVLLGVALGLVAGGTYAGYSWALRRLMRRGVPRSAFAGVVLGAGGVALLPVIAAHGGRLAEAAPLSWWMLAYLAVVPMFLGYVLFSRGLGGIDATTATTLTLIEPAVATVLAVTILHEHLPAAGWVGMALLVAALAVLTRPGGDRLRPQTTPMSTS
ncbi:MAG: EamA family transporter [Gordonia sp. (in: high G+C Gram-positive bacteria)]|uniref:DMT family transporter n=1 Tax=Gordonia sp. (in: high G+C Gram-positive bacteria) TaxID=84139 RepID=UPI0039E4C05E